MQGPTSCAHTAIRILIHTSPTDQAPRANHPFSRELPRQAANHAFFCGLEAQKVHGGDPEEWKMASDLLDRVAQLQFGSWKTKDFMRCDPRHPKKETHGPRKRCFCISV